MAKVNKLGQYKGIEVNVEKHVATQEEVEQQIQGLVAQKPTFIEKEGTVENGDLTTIDFEGF
ncbi:MAG: trigger factor, partial [Coprobacillus sp.]